MNLAVIGSIVSLGKGGAFIAATIQNVVKKHIEDYEDLEDSQILEILTDTAFTLLGNESARSIVEIYLVQMHGNVLFAQGYSRSYDECMQFALSDVRTLLAFNNLDRLAMTAWRNRDQLIKIWKDLIGTDGEPSFDLVGGALDASFELLQAA